MSTVGAIACSFYSQAVFPCVIYLVLAVKEILSTKKIQWDRCIPLVCFLLGALSALIAPGNFRRKEGSSGGQVQILGAIKDAFTMWSKSIVDLLQNPISIIVLFIFLLIGMYVLKETKCKYRYPVVPVIFALVCLYVTYFPFALGYGSAYYLPNRAMFIFNMFAVFLFAVSSMYLGGYLRYQKRILLKEADFICSLVIIGLFAYACLVPTKHYTKIPYVQTIAETEQVKIASEKWRCLLSQIESSDAEEVHLESEVFYAPIVKEPVITSDENDVNNKKVSDYYEKDAVSITWWTAVWSRAPMYLRTCPCLSAPEVSRRYF